MNNQPESVLNPDVYLDVPTYDGPTGQWGYTSFYTKVEWREFITSCFGKVGEYRFDEASRIFNAEGRKWLEQGFYCDAPFKSKDYIHYWDTQKERCRKGVIVKGLSGQTWYLTRDYYMWVNFLPIFHKEKRRFMFPDIYDGQYHTALYEYLAELNNKHAVILKKRQYAMSYYHMAKLINQIWFEEGVTLKLVAYLDDYINTEGSWAFLNEYQDFLNEHTAWFRPFEPNQPGKWQQKTKVTINGRETYRGLKGRLIAITTKQSPTKGVGGASRYIIAEESGINPTLDKTYGYGKSALEAGPFVIVGQFIAYGSVGDLKQCEPLKKYMLQPESNGFFGVPTTDYDDAGTERICGLFIPETWNMMLLDENGRPLANFSDQYGNSNLANAKAALLELREKQKRDLDPEAYQLEISQHPLTIEEAFAWREESPFPVHLVQAQMRRIDEGEYPMEYLDLYRNEKGQVDAKPSRKLPISEFPLPKNYPNKEGVLVVYERPDKNLTPLFTYFASVDPIHTGKTTTSRSLCSIIVYKNPVEVTREKDDGTFETIIEGDKIVAEWCGRMDDIEKVHEMLELIIEWYQAWTLIEYNGSFHTYMTGRKKTHFLVPSNQMIFNKELSINHVPNHPYGWKNVGTIFKTHILPYGIEFLTEELDVDELPNGNRIVKKYGISRVPSKMVCKEMLAYREGMNVDRLVSYCALIAFAKIQQANRGMERRKDRPKNTKPDTNLYKKVPNPFKTRSSGPSIKRSPFRNLR